MTGGLSAADLARFDAGTFPPDRFDHGTHVAVAFAILREVPFHEAVARYARGIRRIAAQTGKADLFSETITIAFLSLIAEAIDDDPGGATDFAAFAAANRHLFDKTVLNRHYSAERLSSAAARTRFVMPDRAAP